MPWGTKRCASDPAPVDPASALVRLSVGQLAVLELTWRDLDTADQREAESLVSDLSKSVENALLEERERMKVADKILAASSVVFLGLLTLLFVRAVGRWSRAARHFSHREDANLRPIQIGSVELIPAGAVRELMRVGALGGGWLLRAVLVYFWAIWSLSLFDSTRGLAQTATGTLLGPLGQLLGRIASQIPVLLALLVTLLVVALIMRFVAAYFHGIERGEIASEWVHPATARITGGLALVALGLVTLLFVAPLVTGSAEGVFSQLGLLALSALALATSPMMVSCALGVRLVYSRSLRLGDELEYGGKRGLVRRVGLFDVTLSDPRGGTIKVPHLMSLWHATQVFPPEPLPPNPAPLDEEEADAP